jgi:peptidoglycan hydrolase-like protein with peptidoglycan-binding domain
MTHALLVVIGAILLSAFFVLTTPFVRTVMHQSKNQSGSSGSFPESNVKSENKIDPVLADRVKVKDRRLVRRIGAISVALMLFVLPVVASASAANAPAKPAIAVYSIDYKPDIKPSYTPVKVQAYPMEGLSGSLDFAVINPGDSGDHVRQIQSVMASKGFSIVVDGSYGPKMLKLVKKIQHTFQVPENGVIDMNMWINIVNTTVAPPAKKSVKTAPKVVHYPDYGPVINQWHDLAISVGWSESNWGWLSCIINRESGGNPNAHSRTNDYGLMQINFSAHHREVEAMYGNMDVMYDPASNLAYGLHLFMGQGKSPWRTDRNSCG